MKRMFKALLAVTLVVLAGAPARANDEQIAKQIIQRLQQQKQIAQLDGFNIGVQVEDGTVTVKGTVTQSEHALMALDIARRVPGVKLVVNDLFVQANAGAPDSLGPSGVAPAAAALPLTAKSSTVSAPVATDYQAVGAPNQLQIGGTAAGFVAPGPPVGSGTTPIAAVPQAAAQQRPLAFAPSTNLPAQRVNFQTAPEYPQATPVQYASSGAPMPIPMGAVAGGATAQASYDNPQMPGYAWPSYAAYPNYAAVTYPHQYSPTAWPYIGPFYPYPQVPLGWRKVTLEWDDGWWFLDFKSK